MLIDNGGPSTLLLHTSWQRKVLVIIWMGEFTRIKWVETLPLKGWCLMRIWWGTCILYTPANALSILPALAQSFLVESC